MANEIIRPTQLPARADPVASEVVPSDNGSSIAGVTWADGVNAGRPMASRLEAEAGVVADKAMSPLTTKQAIDAQVPGIVNPIIGQLGLGDLATKDTVNNADWSGADLAIENGGTGASTPEAARTALSVPSVGEMQSYVQNNAEEINIPAVDIAARNINPNATSFRTNGYYAAGDGGGGLYKKVVSEPSHSGKIQSLDGTWWELVESQPTPRQFGAIIGQASVTAAQDQAFARWVEYIAKVSRFGYIDGLYRLGIECDFTLGGTIPTNGVVLYGDGIGSSELQFNQATVVGLWMLRFGNFGDTALCSDVKLSGFTVRGRNSSITRISRNGILGISNHRWTIEDVRVIYHGSIGLYLSTNFNSDLNNVKISSGGFQHPSFASLGTSYAQTIDGNPVVTVPAGAFTADDIGKEIFLHDAVRRINGRDLNNAHGCTISGVSSPTSITVSPAPTRSSNSVTVNVGKALVSTTASSANIVVSSPVLTPDDEGRFVWIPEADTGGETLHTRIATVTSATTATLEVPAVNTVSGEEFITSVSLHIGGQPKGTPQTFPMVNDIELQQIQIEGYMGAAMYISAGVNFFADMVKAHGKTGASGNMALSGPAVINDCNNVAISKLHMEFNAVRLGRGIIRMCGWRYGAVFSDCTWDGESTGLRLASTPSDAYATSACYLNITDFQSRAIWTEHGGWLDAGGEISRNRAVFSGPVFDPEADGGLVSGTFFAPARMGRDYIWRDNVGVYRIKGGHPSEDADGLAIRHVVSREEIDGMTVIKYSDGIMEQYGIISGIQITFSSSGSVFISDVINVALPVSFASQTRNVQIATSANSIGLFSIPNFSQSTIGARFISATGTGATINLRVFAIGRWR